MNVSTASLSKTGFVSANPGRDVQRVGTARFLGQDPYMIHLAKQGVAFEEASTVFGDPLAGTIPNPRHSAEERLVTIGDSADGSLIVVVHVEGDSRTRIISARRATRRERGRYAIPGCSDGEGARADPVRAVAGSPPFVAPHPNAFSSASARSSQKPILRPGRRGRGGEP